MLKTFVKTTACLAVSAAAIIAAARMEASAAGRTSSPDTTEAKPAPAPSTRKSAPPRPVPAPAPEPKLTVARLATKSSSAEPPASAPIARAGTADVALVTVPDWKGKRLSVARREARKLGLDVTGRTSDGDPVPADEASDYRVRKQLVEAGREVAPGTDVPVRVRMIVDTAEGY
jgi:PASTA domain